MFIRRRPLAAAAVVGGTAYYAGKKRSEAAQAEQAQNDEIAQLQEQNAELQAQQAAPAPAAGGGITDQLMQLQSMLDSGVLTQEEFEAAKAKALAGG